MHRLPYLPSLSGEILSKPFFCACVRVGTFVSHFTRQIAGNDFAVSILMHGSL